MILGLICKNTPDLHQDLIRIIGTINKHPINGRPAECLLCKRINMTMLSTGVYVCRIDLERWIKREYDDAVEDWSILNNAIWFDYEMDFVSWAIQVDVERKILGIDEGSDQPTIVEEKK